MGLGSSVERQQMKVKICLVGEGAVGKTCLIRRFVHDQFDDRYISTLGAKVSKKEVVLKREDGEIDVDLTIWDIMGEKGFRELLKEAYFHGAQGVLAVCDMTRKETLEDVGDWIAAVVKVTGNIPITLVGNKIDLSDRQVVTEEDVRSAAASHEAKYILTSAKTGENVEKAFADLAAAIGAKAS